MVIPVRTRLGALAPDLARGMRAAVATLVPFYFAARLGRQELAWTALGGWLGTLADPSGSRRTRARTLFAFALVGGLTVTVSEAAGNDFWLAPVALAAIALGASLLRTLGSSAATFGTLPAVVGAIGTTHQARASIRDGLWFAAGACLALVLTSVVWPVWRHFPLRKAMAAVFTAMIDYVTALADCLRDGVPEGDARWHELHRLHHRRYREAVEEARSAMLAERARRAGESRVGGNLRVLSGLAQAEWPILVTLSLELESLRERPPTIVDRLNEVTAHWQSIVQVLVTPVLRASEEAPAPAPERMSLGPYVPVYENLLTRLTRESLVAVARANALDAPVQTFAGTQAGLLRQWLGELNDALRTLRDTLTPRSTFFRHGLRVAGAAFVASIVGARLSSHPQWVTITTVAVLQPQAGATVSRAAERVVGTVLGSLVAIAIITTIHSPMGLAWIMFPLSVAAVATQPRSYRLFTFFLTPVFVLLSERYQGDWWTALARTGDAAIGGGIALVAAVLIFPSRERRRLPEITARMLQAVVAYADAVFGSLEGVRSAEGDAHVAEARRGAGVALGESETSLERLLAEPLPRDQEEGADALKLITFARRTASALTALDTLASTSAFGRGPVKGTAATLQRYLDDAFGAAEAFVRSAPAQVIPPVPDLPEGLNEPLGVALTRVLRYAGLVAEVARPRQ